MQQESVLFFHRKSILMELKMYYVEKKLEISASHRLQLDYMSKCENLHGHNWHITIYCKAENLNQNGMVYDFSLIKENIQALLDHKNLNDILDVNPTAENIAKWVADKVGAKCYKVSVQESDGNTAIYEV